MTISTATSQNIAPKSLRLGNPRIRRISFKTIRHYGGTLDYARTKDLLYVKERLGHRSLSSSLRRGRVAWCINRCLDHRTGSPVRIQNPEGKTRPRVHAEKLDAIKSEPNLTAFQHDLANRESGCSNSTDRKVEPRYRYLTHSYQ